MDRAEALIDTMEQADAITWMCLLGSCRSFHDVGRAERAAEMIMKLHPQQAAPYVLLSNIYMKTGNTTKAHQVRKLMEERGIKKIPGATKVEINGMVHTLIAGDKSHPDTELIYAELDILLKELKAAGYVADTSWVIRTDIEAEKEDQLCSHRYQFIRIIIHQ